MYFLFQVDRSYILRSHTWCNNALGVYYSTKGEAERICDHMQVKYNNCTTVYDRDCDGENYRICIEGAEIKESSKGSCTYSAVPGDGQHKQLFRIMFYLMQYGIICLGKANLTSK